MASTSDRSRILVGNYSISARRSLGKDPLHPGYACGAPEEVHPFLTNSRCIEGRHASAVQRRIKPSNGRESKNRNSKDLHLEAIQREDSSRKPMQMPALQLRVSSGDSSIQKMMKRSRSSVLFFAKAGHSAHSPPPTTISNPLPQVYKLDNTSFLDLFQRETRPPPSGSTSKCQRASTMTCLSTRPAESSLRADSNLCLSPISPPTPDNHPWSADEAYVNVPQFSTDLIRHAPGVARSPSTSSRGSDARDGGHYFSSSASQSSQSSIDESNALPSPRSIDDASPKYLVEPKEQACDLEVVQTSPRRNYAGRQAVSEFLSRNKPLPSEPLVDIASPFFEIACPAVRAASRQRPSVMETTEPDNLRLRRSSSSSKRGRLNLPKLSKLSRGERLGLALTLHAQGMKIPNIVRHELPAQVAESGAQAPESCNGSPISKLMSELEIFSRGPSSRQVSHPLNSTVSTPTSSRESSHSVASAARDNDHSGTSSAEMIILSILSLLGIHDLLSAARISKGFYSVFKRYELCLTRSAIFNTCPAAWEYLEEPGKGSKVPAKYLESYRIGVQTIASLRTTLLIRCDALLRQETISGLIRADKEVSKNIDQAFWRIWTFCEIFGHKSSRRENTQAQVDWLKGDRASPSWNSATTSPKSRRPLSSAELIDISEIWTCLASLLQAFHHQTTEAREVGLFERCNIDAVHNQDFYVKQWTSHVMTFGLSAIMELSSCSFDDARASGWTRWSPAADMIKEPPFLAGAVASVYQLRMIEEAEAKADKAVLPRKASGRARSSRKCHTAHRDVLRIQTQNLPRKAVGSPARKASLTLSHPTSSSPRSGYDSHASIPEGSRPPIVAAAPQRAVRRRSAASPTITASMFQALGLQPGASTQIGPTLFPSITSSLTSASYSTQPRPVTPLSSIQSTPIALTQPERVPPRVSNLAGSQQQLNPAPPAHSIYSVPTAVRPLVGPTENMMNLLVNDMGFPLTAVKDALASCDTGSNFDLDTVVAMLVSASSRPQTIPVVKPTVKLVQPSQLDFLSSQDRPCHQVQTRRPSQEARRLVRKKQEKSPYSAQTKLAEFVGSRSKEQKDVQRRQSKIKAFYVLGVSQEPRASALAR